MAAYIFITWLYLWCRSVHDLVCLSYKEEHRLGFKRICTYYIVYVCILLISLHKGRQSGVLRLRNNVVLLRLSIKHGQLELLKNVL